MASQKPVIHGRDHRKGGADPIGAFIEFDIHNEGGTLDIQTDSQDGVTGDGIHLETTGGGSISATAAGSMTLATSGGDLTLNQTDNTSTLVVQSAGDVDVTAAGGDLRLNSSAGNALLQVTGGGADALTISNNGSGDTTMEASGGGDINILNLDSSSGTILIDNLGGSLQLAAKDSITLDATNLPIILRAHGGTTSAEMQFLVGSGNHFTFSELGGHTMFRIDAVTSGDSPIFMFGLPTANPGVTGQLWNSSGTLKVA